MITFRLAFVVPIIAIFLTAPGAKAADTYRIGVSLGENGRFKFPSTMQARAYRMWESDINSRGGLLGKPIEMIILDDKGEADLAKENYEILTEQEPVDIVFGPYSSGLTGAVAPIVDISGYPMLAAGASSDKIWMQGYSNVFGMWTPASRYTVYMLNVALLNGWTKVAIIHSEDPFSASVAEGARKWAKRLGAFEVVAFESFEKGTRDLQSWASKIRNSGAELVIMGGHFNESVDMPQAFQAIGWTPKAYFATVGPTLERFQTTLGDASNCTFATSIWEPNVQFPGAGEFAAAFIETYHETPSYHAATAYAAGQILEEAADLAGTLDHDALREAFSKLDTLSIIGRYSVDRTGMQSKRFPLLIQWQDGVKQIVWPKDRQTAEPKVDCAG